METNRPTTTTRRTWDRGFFSPAYGKTRCAHPNVRFLSILYLSVAGAPGTYVRLPPTLGCHLRQTATYVTLPPPVEIPHLCKTKRACTEKTLELLLPGSRESLNRQIFCQALSSLCREIYRWLTKHKSLMAASPCGQEVGARVSALSVPALW